MRGVSIDLTILHSLPYRARRTRPSLLLCLLLLSILSLVGCKGKQSADDSATGANAPAAINSGILAADILKSLPDNQFGFLVVDTTHADYRKYMAHATATTLTGAGSQSAIAELARQRPELEGSLTLLNTVRDGFSNSGLLSFDPKTPAKLGTILMFLEFNPGTPIPALSGFSTAASGESLESPLASFVSTMNAKGLSLKPHKFGSVSGHTFLVPLGELKTEVPVFVAARGSRLAFGTSESRVNAFVNASPSSSASSVRQQLAQNPKLQKLVPQLGSARQGFAFGYFDITKVLQTSKTLVAASGSTTAPEAMEQIPFDAAAMAASFEQQSYALLSNPKTDAQRSAFARLQSNVGAAKLESLPADSLLGIHIDGAVLQMLKAAALAETPELEQFLPPEAKYIDSLQSIGISVRGPTGPLPMPDVGVALRSPDVNAMRSSVRGALGSALAQQLGANEANLWQKKSIGSSQAELAMSPLGIGAYLGGTIDNLVLTSSERMYSDLMPDSKTKTLATILPDNSSGKVFLDLFLNFQLLAQTMQQLQSSLALFTGGQNVVDNHTLESLRALGTLRVGARYSQDVLAISVLNKPGSNTSNP